MNERTRAAELARVRQRERDELGSLPALIDERVGEHIEKLETKLVDSFREMGQRVVEESTQALNSQLDSRITQLEQVATVQTETLNEMRDSSRVSEAKISGIVTTVERALGDAVPGFRLAPPSHLPRQLNAPDNGELTKAERSYEESKDGHFCPHCTSKAVRRAKRSGFFEEILRWFFIAPYRCRACRHKFYRF
jgi:hypothetical protein